jgi:beta-lactamase regulating signal transducer with metallopeptidase domain
MNLPTLPALLPALTEAFDYVVRASSLTAAAIMLVVVARGILGARLAPAARGWLWLPVALLCLSPRLPALISWSAPAEAIAKPVREVFEPALGPIVVRGEPRPLLNVDTPAPRPVQPQMTTQEKLAIAWGAGSVSILAFWLTAYAGLWRRIRREQGTVSERLSAEFRECVRRSGLRQSPRLLVTGAVDNPAVAGLWRPTVLIPPGLEESLDRSSLRHVLLHELGHIRRLDLWLHWTSALVVALHWFNPLMWLASRKFRADREAACDAAVIHASDDQAHAYGETLLALGSRTGSPSTARLMAGMLGGADLVKQRIVDITRRSRNSRAVACCAFTLVMSGAGMIAVLAADPAPPTVTATPTGETAQTKADPVKAPTASEPKAASKDLYTRTFRVPPDFLVWIQEQNQQNDPASAPKEGLRPRPTAIELLKKMGVPFPEGASATFVATTSQLIVRNTMDNLEVIAAIVEARLSNPIKQVYVTCQLVVFKEGSKPNLLGTTVAAPEVKVTTAEPIAGQIAPPVAVHPVASTQEPFALSGVFTDPQFQVVWRTLAGKGVPMPTGKPENGTSDSLQNDIARQVEAVISMPSVTTRSGQKATVEVVREFAYPIIYERVEGATKDTEPKVVPTRFEMKPVGFQLEIEPTIGPDGYTLDLVLAPQLPAFTGWREFPIVDGEKVKNPIFESRKVTTSVTIWDGQTVAFAGEASVSPFLMNPSLKGEAATLAKRHPVMIFVTARMIDPSGQPVKAATAASTSKTVEPGPQTQVVPFRLGPKKFANADLIELLEVRSTSSRLEKGDTVIVKGRCRLGSQDEAELRLMTTTVTGESTPAVDVALDPSVSLERGMRPFEFRHTLQHEGLLKVSLRQTNGGATFGEVYFGTQEQMDKASKVNR